AGRRHLSGMPSAFPADPDDDYGGAVCWDSAGIRRRYRRGIAAAAWNLNHWRIAGQPASYAVHNSRHLPGLRSPCGTIRYEAESWCGGESQSRGGSMKVCLHGNSQAMTESTVAAVYDRRYSVDSAKDRRS